MTETVVLGRIVGAHGVRGWVRVHHFGDGPENLLGLSHVGLARSEQEPAEEREVEERGAGRPGEVRMRFAGVTSREQAEALRGWLVSGPRAALEPLEEGEHYWFELVGCRVELPDGRTIGTVRELWATGGHDVLVVEGEQGRRHLIPAVDEFLVEVDVAGKRIRIDPIPGLLDEGGP
jgi:16S rRNA processing protein RimM